MIEQIKKYLSKNEGKYSYDALETQLLKSGYLKEDILEAKHEVDLENARHHEDVALYPSPTDSYGDPAVKNPHTAHENLGVLKEITSANMGHNNKNLDYLKKEDEPKTPVVEGPSSVNDDSKHFINPVLVILFSFITFGIYIPFWYIRQNGGFVQNEKEPVGKGLIAIQLSMIVIFILMILTSIIAFSVDPIESVAVIDVMNALAYLVVFVIYVSSLTLGFQFKKAYKKDYNMESNGVLTFFFAYLYLQIVINEKLKK